MGIHLGIGPWIILLSVDAPYVKMLGRLPDENLVGPASLGHSVRSRICQERTRGLTASYIR